MRQCGDCQLCCKLLPVRELGKKADERCSHQRFKKGCAVYHRAGMPPSCALWNCRWLVNNDMDDVGRPDRSHVVVDMMPDYVTIQDNETGQQEKVQVVQVWCDPRYPDAHRDPAFRRYLARRGEEGIIALIRFNSRDAITIIPPAMSPDGQFHEIIGGQVEKRTERDMAEFLTGATLGLEIDP